MIEAGKWYPVDGDDHGFEGDVLLYHKTGYRIAHSNWIGSHQMTYGKKQPEPAFNVTVGMGYTWWMPILAPGEAS